MEGSAASLAPDVAARAADKVVEGKHGWLFLGRDTNDVIHQHTGRLRFDQRRLEDWRHVLENRDSWLGQRQIPYLFLVPPNAHSVYPEHLPDWVAPVAARPVLQLLDHFRDTESQARIIYPLDELVAHKEHDLVYAQTDTHWNELGAFLAYRLLMREVARRGVEVREIPWEQLFVSRADVVGDLGEKLTPVRSSIQVFADVTNWRAHYAQDNRVQHAGRRVEYRCDVAPDTTLFIHGDSFSEKLMHFLGESFGRVVYCQMPSLDYEVVNEVAPDVVIGILNERFLLRVPYDATAPTQAELEVMKRMQGRVFGPPKPRHTPRLDGIG